MKTKITCIFLAVLLLCSGCKSSQNEIMLFSREEGSGTRDMFVNDLDILTQGIDNISRDASITNSGAVMLSAVEGNPGAIGYISAAAANDKVKMLRVNGYLPADGEKYPLFRDFILVYDTDSIAPAVEDFLRYLRSDMVADTILDMGYFGADNVGKYTVSNVEGKVVVSGSASVFPLMDRIREEYMKIQPNVEIEIQQNDSSTGISLLGQGLVDIAMSSRKIRDGELVGEYQSMTLAGDAIAVIVHPSNQFDEISSIALKRIYEGSVVEWNKING